MMPRRYVIASGLLVGCLALSFLEWQRQTDGKLHVYIADVGQGDGILIVTPSGKQILIDGGPDTSLLERIGEHMPMLDRTIELLILSHPDSDHISALPDVLRRYDVQQIALNGTSHMTGRYEALLHLIAASNIPVILPDPSQNIYLDDGVSLDILWPEATVFGSKPEAANDESFVVKLLYRDHSMLFTGDIEEKAEDRILALGADLRSDILKVPHHGSRTSSSTGFLLAIQPKLAVISAGRENKFGHPHQDVLKRYESFGIPIRSTVNEGTISLVFE